MDKLSVGSNVLSFCLEDKQLLLDDKVNFKGCSSNYTIFTYLGITASTVLITTVAQ